MRAGIVPKAALSVLLSFLLAASIVYAQVDPPDPTSPQQLVVTLDDGLSISEVLVSSSPHVTRSITDSLSVDDSTDSSKAEAVRREAADRLAVRERVTQDLHAYRFISERLRIGDPFSMKGPMTISMSEPLQISDGIRVGGALEPRSPPIITLQPGAPAIFSPNGDGVDDTIQIAFDSTAGGTYAFEIRDAQGQVASSLTGSLSAGRNTVTWDGTDSSGNTVSPGTYTYYISARNEGGVRAPPPDGDGIIVVETPSAPVPPAELNYTALVAAVAVAAGGTGLLFYLRRRKELVLYLPAAASEVIGEIREKYPAATVEDFVEPAEGGTKMYKGVKIENPGKDDESWFTDVISKVKELAGVDSVNISYRGKVRSV